MTALQQILEVAPESAVHRKCSHILVRMAQDETAIATLEDLAQTAEPPINRQAAASSAQLVPGHPLGAADLLRPKKRHSQRMEFCGIWCSISPAIASKVCFHPIRTLFADNAY